MKTGEMLVCPHCHKKMWVMHTEIPFVTVPICPLCDSKEVLAVCGLQRVQKFGALVIEKVEEDCEPE